MINITKHFMERWVERIVGISAEKEINEYIGFNREKIEEDIQKTTSYSEFVYRGQIGDNITRNYYIKDNIVLVTNTTDDALITVYKTDFNFTDSLNATVTKELINEVHSLTEEKEKIEQKINEEVENKQFEIMQNESMIELLELRLAELKKSKIFKEQEIKEIKKESLEVGLELKKYALLLVDSKQYRKDLLDK